MLKLKMCRCWYDLNQMNLTAGHLYFLDFYANTSLLVSDRIAKQIYSIKTQHTWEHGPSLGLSFC